MPDAQYWLGESLFQQQHYRDAAKSFLGVSTKFERAGKAPDALLRLGQSLAAMNQKEAACATLAEVEPQISARLRRGETRRRAGTEACALLRRESRLGSRKPKSLFSGLQAFPVLVLAVSGGPDSTALMVLAARWRDSLKTSRS